MDFVSRKRQKENKKGKWSKNNGKRGGRVRGSGDAQGQEREVWKCTGSGDRRAVMHRITREEGGMHRIREEDGGDPQD